MKSYNYNNSIINIKNDYNKLNIEIETKRSKLKLKSVNDYDNDFKYYKKLFQDELSIKMYASGEILSDDNVLKRFNTWYNRFNNDNDPYSSFMIFNNDGNQFIGQVCLGHSNDNGISECSILLFNQYWGKGYGFEVLNTIVNEYSNCLLNENYNLNGEPLKKIIATARVDNDASNRILLKCGFSKYNEIQLYGNKRNLYELNIHK